jgi:hypothetical protein
MISFQLLGVEVKRTLVYGWEPSAANKVLRLDYSGGLYTLSINGIEVASEFSQVRPDTIGFGHPPAYYIPFSPTHVASVMGGWSSLKIDYIKALSTPIASSPSQTPRPSSTPTPTLTPTLTPNPTPTPELKTSKLVFTCETSNIQSTFKVQINGKLNSEENNPIPKADILLSYSVTNGDTWINLTSVNTDNTGSFSVVWMPSVTGNYQVKATWPGNSTHLKIKEIVNFAVTPYAEQSVFSVSSNSTLSAFTFNSTKNELSFSVTGALDTTGYVNVYIPKSLILDISFLKVYLDGTQLSFTNESQEDSWIIHFIYYHSTHTINIDLGSEQTNPSDQSEPLSIIYYAVPLAIIVAIIAILALTLVKKMPKK